jgi:hypothetical protein
MNTVKALIGALCLLALGASSPKAGVLVKGEVRAIDAAGQNGHLTMYIDKDRLRVEYEGEKGHGSSVYQVIDGEPVVWLIDQKANTYREARTQDIQKLRATIDDQLTMMESQLQKMEREKREEVETQYRAQIESMTEIARPYDPKKISYKKEEEKKKVNDWMCDQYTRSYRGKVDRTYAVVPWEKLGITKDDLKVLTDAQDAAGGLVGDLSFVTLWNVGHIEAFPVRIDTFIGDTKMDIIFINSVTKQDIDPTVFQLGSDLTQQDFMQ